MCFNWNTAVISPAPVLGPVPNESILTESDASLLFSRAHTAYTFTDELVIDTQLRAIHELAKWTPAAADVQPPRVIAIRSAAARERLLSCFLCGSREQAAGAPLILVCAADRSFAGSLPRSHPRGGRYQWPLEGGEVEIRARWACTPALIQTAYVIQATHAVRLAAGPMNGDDTKMLATRFFAGQSVKVLLVINTDYPGPDAYQEHDPHLPLEEAYRVL